MSTPSFRDGCLTGEKHPCNTKPHTSYPNSSFKRKLFDVVCVGVLEPFDMDDQLESPTLFYAHSNVLSTQDPRVSRALYMILT